MTEKDHASDVVTEKDRDVNRSITLNDLMESQDRYHIADNTEPIFLKAIQEHGLPENLVTHEPEQTRTTFTDQVMPPIGQKGKVELFTKDTGPQLYKAKGSLVTAPIITKNLPKVFEYLPIHGKPQDNTFLKDFFSNKIREFVGCGLTDDEFQQLEDYCRFVRLLTQSYSVKKILIL